MPAKVEACVADFMKSERNIQKWPDESKRKQAAFAICNSAILAEPRRGYVLQLEAFEDDKPTWLHLLPIGEYEHPVYGDISITPGKIANFIKNHQKNVRGIMLDIDYAHKNDPAKGNKAAGWIVSLEQRDDGLWGLVTLTGEAREEVADGAWKYMSAEYQDTWCDAKGSCYDDVLFGASLTNRPFMKELSPINLEEFDDSAFSQPAGKYPQDVANYRQASDSLYRCANCAFFQPQDNTCLTVAGDISPDWTSDFFKPMYADLTQAMELSEDSPDWIDPIELEVKEFRDIPVSERNKHPASDFAGSGKSFPIFKCEDVTAAFHALGLTNQNKSSVRSRIISIAKRKGFTSCLPESVKAEEFYRKLFIDDELVQDRILDIASRR